MMLISRRVVGFFIYSLISCSSFVYAQNTYPDRPIKLIVGYPPGGAADFVARVTAEQISREIGVAVTVENRPGAGGAIAADLVAKAPPDGYTISLYGPHAQIKALYPKMSLEESDFVPVTNIATGSMIICANPKVPYKNLRELIAFSKANPGVIFNASSGNGSTPHLAAALFESVANVKFTESGLSGYNSTFSYGLYFPASTSAAITNKMFVAASKGMAQPGVKQRLAAQGMDITTSKSPAEFLVHLRAEAPALAEIVRISGAKLE